MVIFPYSQLLSPVAAKDQDQAWFVTARDMLWDRRSLDTT